MTPARAIPPMCRNCIHYKVSERPNEPPKCHIFYRQHPTHMYSYFETAEEMRNDKRMCGPDGRWFIGVGGEPRFPLRPLLSDATHNSSVSLPTFTPLLRTCQTIIDSDKDNS